jgi:hypothetical protein
MNDMEKYRAEIEAKMTEFDKTLMELKKKAAKQHTTAAKNSNPTPELDELFEKSRLARKRLDEMKEEQSREGYSWEKFKSDMEHMFDDINKDLRKALSYYK